jgi:hypothetical protein
VVEGRREFVLRLARAAGVAPLALGVLEGRGLAAAKDDRSDLEILYAALALEHYAIALYEEGLRRGAFAPGLRSYVVEFHGDHLGHRDTQIAIAEERGGHPPAPLPSYDWAGLGQGDRAVRAGLSIEVAAQQAYTELISQIRTQDYLLSAAFILVDEVRHMTVWRRVLGIRIY